MSVTVVTTRDYDDVPCGFDKYELGTLWRINSGDLEIFVGRTLVALYPSGNWVSVFADDAMQLFKEGTKPDYSTMPTVDAPVARRSAAAEDPMGTPVAVPPNQPVSDDDHTTYPDDSVPIADQLIVPNDEVIAARAAMTPVTFRPRRYRAAPPPAKKAPTGPRMLPVKLRMRPFRGVRETEPAGNTDPAPRMMKVTMRSTIYRAARPLRPEVEAPGPVEDPDDDVTSDSP